MISFDDLVYHLMTLDVGSKWTYPYVLGDDRARVERAINNAITKVRVTRPNRIYTVRYFRSFIVTRQEDYQDERSN